MQLRGFDTYEITLGDEMRGERASMGKSLADVERDLRIKGPLIEAIENCDLSAFATHSVIAGYVRCYARYLGMDVTRCYERFCEESGFRSPVAMIGGDGFGKTGSSTDPLNCTAGAQLAKSRFAAPPIPSGFSIPISLGGLISSTALVAIIGGLSYGGYALLQDIQRVGFAPLVEAPDIVAEAPAIDIPQVDPEFARPDASAYSGDGALAGLAPSELPKPLHLRRDGPISAIDPSTYGVFARPEVDTPPREGVASGVIDSADDAIAQLALQGQGAAQAAGPARSPSDSTVVAAAEPVQTGITVHAVNEAWVSIRESTKTILFQGTLNAGQRFSLPSLADDPVLRAGNAGDVYVLIDGIGYGPVGRPGSVVKNLSLSAEAIREQFPQAMPSDLGTDVETGTELTAEQRAAVDLN
ncbi:MAG: helix-turn-helix domain-containing protein [Pseudomonadota bacterium]